MKRIICLALCVLMAVFACACGNDKTEPTQAQTEAATETASADSITPTESSVKAGLKSFISSFDTTAAVEDKTVYEKTDFSVTLHKIDYSAAIGPQLKLTFKNNYNKDIVVQPSYTVVNGYMISPEMEDVTVAKGKSADGTLSLPYFNLAISNITCLQQIQFSLKIVEKGNYNPIDKTDLITVDTSKASDKETVCDESGQIAYDQDGVKIVLKGVNTDRAYSDGAELIVYMCNDTEQNIAIQTKNVTVNGYVMTSAMNRSILSGKKAVDVVPFYALDMEEYDIESIDSVTVSFVIKDADTWETIDSTDSINVDLKQPETFAATTAATEAEEAPDTAEAEDTEE